MEPPLSQEDYLNYHMQAAEQQRAAMLANMSTSEEEQHQQDEEIELSKDQIWKQLEEQRFHQLRLAAVNLSSDMLLQ